MNNKGMRVAVVAVCLLLGTAAGAQQTATIDFKSVGRATPLSGGHQQARDHRCGDPAVVRPTTAGRERGPVHRGCAQWRSPAGRQAAAGGSLHLEGFLQGPCALDRSALLPLQQPGRDRGSARRHRDGTDRRRSAAAAWGYCDRDYPREAIVSPYAFKTAQAHYEALLPRRSSAAGPRSTPTPQLPGDWNGR